MTAGQGYTFGPYRFDPTEGRLTRDGNNKRKPARETKLDSRFVEPFEDAANKNTPPKFRFEPNGPIFTGPPSTIAGKFNGTVGVPDVKCDNVKPTIDRAADGKSVANATFSAPGDYILRVEGNDSTGSGGGGFQCCWSNAHVNVSVKPAAGTGGQ